MNIFITGGASGLGLAITQKLLNKGNKILITYNKAEEVAKELERSANVTVLKCDFASADDIEIAKKAISDFNVDVLINNAFSGVNNAHFHKISKEQFTNNFHTNILSTILITQEAVTIFKKKKFGKIITIISSGIVNKPPLGWSEYIASKAYLNSLSKSWATEYAKFNITSNCVSPSFMLTNMTSYIDERVIETMKEQRPLKKLLEPKEVADVVEFFVNSSQQVNGVNLIIN